MKEEEEEEEREEGGRTKKCSTPPPPHVCEADSPPGTCTVLFWTPHACLMWFLT